MSGAQALPSTEVVARKAHGDHGRIKSARFPARKTRKDFSFQPPAEKTLIEHPSGKDYPARAADKNAA
jgi:hypothetical protein